MAEKIFYFEITNFQALGTLTIYSNISKILIQINNWLLIQITLCRNARIQMDISKKNRFSAEKAINYFPSHWEKKKGTNMWNAWVLRVFLLSHASNFLMGTEDNSIQRQLYDSFIIYVGAALPMRNDFLILYCHKELHRRWSVGPRSPLVCFFFLWERLKFNQVDIYIFKVKRNSTTTRCEICPKLTIKATKRC